MLHLYIEDGPESAAVQQVLRTIPDAQVRPDEELTRDIDFATALVIMQGVTTTAKMIAALGAAGLSVAKLAKFITNWKREVAARKKTILIKEAEDGEPKRLTVKEDTTPEQVEKFLTD